MLHLLWESTFFGLVSAGVLTLAAVGFTLQFGVTNIMNLAYGTLMTLAAFLAYTSAFIWHFNFWISMIIAVLLTGVLSVILNRSLIQPFIRKGSAFFTLLMVTFGLGIIIDNGIMVFWGPQYFSLVTTGNRTLHFIGWNIVPSQLAILAVSAASMLGIHLLLTYTDIGKAMRAMSDDEGLAQLCGVRTRVVSDFTWFASGMMSGLAGIVLAVATATFSHDTGTLYLMTILAAALLGGVGRPYGAMLGAVIIGIATEWYSALAGSAYSFAVALLALVIVLLFRPQGILSGKGGS